MAVLVLFNLHGATVKIHLATMRCGDDKHLFYCELSVGTLWSRSLLTFGRERDCFFITGSVYVFHTCVSLWMNIALLIFYEAFVYSPHS